MNTNKNKYFEKYESKKLKSKKVRRLVCSKVFDLLIF